jgi:hypothetical protein
MLSESVEKNRDPGLVYEGITHLTAPYFVASSHSNTQDLYFKLNLQLQQAAEKL